MRERRLIWPGQGLPTSETKDLKQPYQPNQSTGATQNQSRRVFPDQIEPYDNMDS